MTPSHIQRAVRMGSAASYCASLAEAFQQSDPAKARKLAREAEAALYEALDALSQSGLADLSNQAIAARAAQQEFAA